ncbi:MULTISPECIES: amino acid ABC transporter permease [Paenibacillus]|jgi:cystine transport system permease protein|uniref:Cysteine ABC transporter permease n=1 Tax=Paenibacillus rhizosphaerae TaxID=297318 RepID=A0A1R1F348_9BACL|nr:MULTISPECIES: amino acid ABC transporter permease [Paenibacillus]OMF58493.1 cysteine ABC transporter permease [Paenibacillus rhizosphaerae]OXL82775.1 cysteine ABC transporter permease [Paenibacillus sp. SSG-1]UYO03642.1 amino acid ABC transporter permease [Paenibacillus sp. PSB04]
MNDRTAHLTDIFIDSFVPLLMAGIKFTIPLTIISFILGFVLAFLTALARLSRWSILQRVAWFYVWIIRGTPLLVQLFIIFYGLPSIGVVIDAFTAAVIGFSISVGAYGSEIMRAAIQSIAKGQWEAAYSVGMTRSQALRRIVLPQAARVSLPPLANSFISLLKDTSLAATVTLTELFQKGQQITAVVYEPLLLYCEVALIYLIFSTVLSAVQHQLEHRFDRYAAR